MDTTLTTVSERRVRIILIDVSAVPVIDPAIVTALIHLGEAIRLLGARVMLVGMRAEMAQTIIHLDMAFDTLETARDLQSALAMIAVQQPIHKTRTA